MITKSSFSFSAVLAWIEHNTNCQFHCSKTDDGRIVTLGDHIAFTDADLLGITEKARVFPISLIRALGENPRGCSVKVEGDMVTVFVKAHTGFRGRPYHILACFSAKGRQDVADLYKKQLPEHCPTHSPERAGDYAA
jgi:hypothetical protein